MNYCRILDYETFSTTRQLTDYVYHSAIKQSDIQEIIYNPNAKQWVLIYWR